MVEDSKSFVFSLDQRELVFKPKDYKEALLHGSIWGPNFCGSDLATYHEPFNGPDKGDCYIRNRFIGDLCDSEGNHVLTGDGKGKKNDKKRWTCTALEIYLVTY